MALAPPSFVRMSVGSRGVCVSEFAMFVSRGCVLLGLVVLTEIVVMGSFKMMVRGSLMVKGRPEVMLTSRMFR